MQFKKIWQLGLMAIVATVGFAVSEAPTMAAAKNWRNGMPSVLKGSFTSRYQKTGGYFPTLTVSSKKIIISTQPKVATTLQNLAYKRSTPVSYLIKGTYKNGGRAYLRMMFGTYQGKSRISYRNSHQVNGKLVWTKHYAGWFYQK